MQSEPKRFRHKKRGTTYQVLHSGCLQVDGDLDNERVTVYRCEQDGGIWVRPDYEFNDGRFEELPSLAAPSPISADAVVDLAEARSENEKLREMLEECSDYFDNRADADCDQDGFIPNREMEILSKVKSALEPPRVTKAVTPSVASENDRFRRMVERRDEFIIGKGLWDEFKEATDHAY